MRRNARDARDARGARGARDARDARDLAAELASGRGFVVLRGYCSGPSLERVREAFARAAAQVARVPDPTLPTTSVPPKRIWNLLDKDPLLLELPQPEPGGVLDQVLCEFLGRGYLLAGSFSNTLYAGRRLGSWHQDYPYNVLSKLRLGSNDNTSAGRRDEEDEGNANALELTTLLALDDFTAENGATKRTRRLLGAHWHDFNASQACKRRKYEGKQDDEHVKKVKL
eukprot:g3862.t1